MAGMTRSNLAQLERAPSDRTLGTLAAGNLPALAALDRGSLRQLWRELFSRAAPSRASHALLVYGLAYRMQENAYGGLSAAARTRLHAIAQQLGPGKPSPKNTAARIAPGTRLIRQWRTQRHEVTVLEKGYAYRGSRYPSLSAIARLISGTHCSGPRFFGLTAHSASNARVADAA